MKTNFRLATIIVVTVVSLFLVSEAMAKVNTYSSNVTKDIPDPGETYPPESGEIVSSGLKVPDSLIIEDVDVVVTITHKYFADLDVYLVGPDGTEVELFTDVFGFGNKQQNCTDLILDDEAPKSIESIMRENEPPWPPYSGSWKPEGKLSDFDGLNAEGTWQLKVEDDEGGLSGELRSWSLVIEGGPPPVEPVEPNEPTPVEPNEPAPVEPNEPAPIKIIVEAGGDIAAANAIALPGDIIDIAAGTFVLAEQIEIKDGVTYQGAGPELTIIDGGGVTRAFAAWGDRGATSGQIDDANEGVPNLTGPTGWVLDGLTIQNCVSGADNRQDILSAARDLLTNYTGTPYTLATAQAENGGVTDNPGWFDILSGGADDDLTDVELQAYLDGNPPGSAGHLVVNDDKRDDGSAVCILNGADGTIRNCTFSNNWADDDGGAVHVDGNALVVAIENCAFNLSSCGDQGGAVKLSGNKSESTVTGCSFTDCASDDDGGAIYMDGHDSIYTVTDTTFTRCNTTDEGGAIQGNANDSSYVWTGCTFTGCYALDDGAAVNYEPDRSELTMTNCVFIGNGKDPDGTAVTDDGVFRVDDDDAGPVTVSNCLFVDNAVKDDRIVEVKALFAILNCTFANNVLGDKCLISIRGRDWDSTGDGEKDATTDDSIVSNCLFINNNTDGDVIGDNRNDDGLFAVTVTNCLFYGNVDLNGTDPADNVRDIIVEVGTIDVSAVTDAAQLVVDPAGDYHLVAGSAAIDASDPATATATDIEGTAAVGVRDVGAYELSAN